MFARLLIALVLVLASAGCGPAYVGVRAGPPVYVAPARPYYAPYGYYAPRYYAPRYYAPAPVYRGYGWGRGYGHGYGHGHGRW